MRLELEADGQLQRETRTERIERELEDLNGRISANQLDIWSDVLLPDICKTLSTSWKSTYQIITRTILTFNTQIFTKNNT